MNKLLENIRNNIDTRANLIELKARIKDESELSQLKTNAEAYGILTGALDNEDAKARKNAALVLGEAFADASVISLWQAYKREETLFVKESYLCALSLASDLSDVMDELKAEYEIILKSDDEANKKHFQAQLKVLEKILGIGEKHHKFTGFDKRVEVVLTVDAALRSMLEKQIKAADRECLIKNHPFGIAVQTEHLSNLLKLRTYRDVLFMIRCKDSLGNTYESIANGLSESNIKKVIGNCLGVSDGEVVRFRIECKSALTGSDKSKFVKKIADLLEEKTGRSLINSTDDYELEIRLTEKKDGSFYPILKFYGLKDNRFDYRKNTLATSTNPSIVSAVMSLASDYMSEDGCILDAFTGCGTFIIEREGFDGARDKYAVDIFGEAIKYAKDNAKLAGVDVNFITRDIMDFTSKHPFDEIYADMPLKSDRSKEELAALYDGFFAKAAKLLNIGGHIFVLSNEKGLVMKNLRLHDGLHLEREFLIRSKDEMSLYIIKTK